MKKLIIILFAVGLSVSCNNDLDLAPTGSLTEETAFETVDDLLTGLIGAYHVFTFNSYTSRMFSEAPDMMADDLAEYIESLSNSAALSNWTYIASNGDITNCWTNIYLLISRVNTVIANANRITIDPADQLKLNRVLAQAYTMRAMAHFDLLRYFGQSYNRNSTELGIPVITEVPEAPLSFNPERNSVAEVYDQIFADLTEAESRFANIDQAINTSSQKQFIDKNTMNALYARIYLYTENWPEAIARAGAVISEVPLAQGTAFRDVWQNDNESAEVIFSVQHTANDTWVGSRAYFAPNDIVGYIATDAYVSLFPVPADDIRFESYLSSTLRPGVMTVDKYRGYFGRTDGVTDMPYFRVGEMYLIRAEAKARGGNNSGVDDLNDLRAARINGYVDQNLSGNALINAIKNERRKELFMEGHRWFDLKRYGEGVTRGADCVAPALACSLPANSGKFVLPIPDAEMNKNPNMIQNPGY